MAWIDRPPRDPPSRSPVASDASSRTWSWPNSCWWRPRSLPFSGQASSSSGQMP